MQGNTLQGDGAYLPQPSPIEGEDAFGLFKKSSWFIEYRKRSL
jgi:hypothetical protein